MVSYFVGEKGARLDYLKLWICGNAIENCTRTWIVAASLAPHTKGRARMKIEDL